MVEADDQVENILMEIRERVRAEQRQLAPPPRSPNDLPTPDNSANGRISEEAYARLESYLTTTARAWDRLPPVVSNRSGAWARLELWVKRQLKRGTRWYAWEQVNFNAAVHHAIKDTLAVLLTYEQRLSQLQRESHAEREKHDAELAQLQSSIDAQFAMLKRSLAAVEKRWSEIENGLDREQTQHRTMLESLVADLNAQRIADGEQLAAFVNEVRTRNERLLEEQRVCFKQLSLEAGETAVVLDRARRELQERLEQMEKQQSNLS
jgi:hypothetical protein